MIQKPNLDRLAADGLRFTQHYAGRATFSANRLPIIQLACPIAAMNVYRKSDTLASLLRERSTP